MMILILKTSQSIKQNDPKLWEEAEVSGQETGSSVALKPTGPLDSTFDLLETLTTGAQLHLVLLFFGLNDSRPTAASRP